MKTLQFFENELVPVARRLNKVLAVAATRTNADTPARDKQAVAMYVAQTWQALHGAALAVRAQAIAPKMVAPLLQALAPTVAELGTDHKKLLQVLRDTQVPHTRLLQALGTDTTDFASWAARLLAECADGLPVKGRRSLSWWTTLVDSRPKAVSHPKRKRGDEIRALIRAMDDGRVLTPLEPYLSISVEPRSRHLVVTAEFDPAKLPPDLLELLPLAAKAKGPIAHAFSESRLELLTDTTGFAATVAQLQAWYSSQVEAARAAAPSLRDISEAQALDRARATLAKLKPQDRAALRKLLASEAASS